MRLSTTSYAVLGLLAIQPWTTYELATQIERSLRWFWPVSRRNVYDEAKRLADAGLAHAESSPVGNRPRTIYSITEDGREELRIWLDEPAALLQTQSASLVKVFFADAGEIDDLHRTLRRMHDAALERRTVLAAIVEELLEQQFFLDRLPINTVSLRFHLDINDAVLRWAEWALDATREWDSPTDPGDWDPRTAFDA